MQEFITLYCPDCRGKFELDTDDVLEGEVVECALCGAEILVKQKHPLQVKLFTEEDDF